MHLECKTRSRRPHVPSSKPTMSKSAKARRQISPLFTGAIRRLVYGDRRSEPCGPSLRWSSFRLGLLDRQRLFAIFLQRPIKTAEFRHFSASGRLVEPANHDRIDHLPPRITPRRDLMLAPLAPASPIPSAVPGSPAFATTNFPAIRLCRSTTIGSRRRICSRPDDARRCSPR